MSWDLLDLLGPRGPLAPRDRTASTVLVASPGCSEDQGRSETPDLKEREDRRVTEEIPENHTQGHLDLQEYKVLLVSTAWLGTADPAREDLRARPERPVSRVRRALQVSQGSARRRCVWPHRPTPPQDYRRLGGSKDKGYLYPTITCGQESEREK